MMRMYNIKRLILCQEKQSTMNNKPEFFQLQFFYNEHVSFFEHRWIQPPSATYKSTLILQARIDIFEKLQKLIIVKIYHLSDCCKL